MDSKIRIIIDQAIPFIEGVLEPYADVIYKEGRAISREDAMNADALIISKKHVGVLQLSCQTHSLCHLHDSRDHCLTHVRATGFYW